MNKLVVLGVLLVSFCVVGSEAMAAEHEGAADVAGGAWVFPGGAAGGCGPRDGRHVPSG